MFRRGAKKPTRRPDRAAVEKRRRARERRRVAKRGAIRQTRRARVSRWFRSERRLEERARARGACTGRKKRRARAGSSSTRLLVFSFAVRRRLIQAAPPHAAPETRHLLRPSRRSRWRAALLRVCACSRGEGREGEKTHPSDGRQDLSLSLCRFSLGSATRARGRLLGFST